MTVKISRWDSAEYLNTEEDIQAYLDAILEEAGDDPAYIVHALSVIARARNMSQIAKSAGISREGLYKALSRDGNPSFTTVARIARALNLRITVQASVAIPEKQV